MMRTLFLQAPSFEGFDGGAGARYQNRREIKSFWYPTWLAQPAALVEDSKLIALRLALLLGVVGAILLSVPIEPIGFSVGLSTLAVAAIWHGLSTASQGAEGA